MAKIKTSPQLICLEKSNLWELGGADPPHDVMRTCKGNLAINIRNKQFLKSQLPPLTWWRQQWEARNTLWPISQGTGTIWHCSRAWLYREVHAQHKEAGDPSPGPPVSPSTRVAVWEVLCYHPTAFPFSSLRAPVQNPCYKGVPSDRERRYNRKLN